MRKAHKTSALAVIVSLGIGLSLARAAETAKTQHAQQGIIRGIYCDPGKAIGNSAWSPYGDGFELSSRQVHSGKASLHCRNGTPAGRKGVSQRVTLDQDRPRPLVIAGWAKVSGVAGPPSYRCSVYLDARLSNGQNWQQKTAEFDPAKTDGWQYAEKIYTPPAPVVSANVCVFLREAQGEAWFDDLYVGELIDAQGTRSKNLLQNAGFEGAAEGGSTFRDDFFNTLASLNCNAFHFYRSASWDTVMNPAGLTPVSPDDPLFGFISDAHRRGFKVWLTVGPALPVITDMNSPEFPFFACVNSRWGEAYTRSVAYFTQYGVDGIGVVPDEWTWSNDRVKKAFAAHKDPGVAAFYKKLPDFCDCEICRRMFQKREGISLPDVTQPWRLDTPTWTRVNSFRYDSTSAWMQRSVAAAKAVNPSVITDTMICVLPICSDNRSDAGAAWDKIGADTKLDCLQTDPYILLHNYLGDSTHYYTTETAIHLAAANRDRLAGVTLEVARLRDIYRNKEPAEVYGAALSCLAHGASEFFWWHLTYILGNVKFVAPELPARQVTATYQVMREMEPYVAGAKPSGEILVLYSRRSEDVWQALARGEQPPAAFGQKPSPRRGFVAQKNVIHFLLRRGYPFQMTYLDSPEPSKLAAAKAVVVPFPFALKASEAALVDDLARSGKTVLLLSGLSPADEQGHLLPSPALAGLFGDLLPDRGAGLPATAQIGKGSAVFFGDAFADRLFEELAPVKDPKVRVPLPGFSEQQAALLDQALTRALGKPGSAFAAQPAQDVELTVLDRPGDRLVLAVNWDPASAADVSVRPDVSRTYKTAQGFSITGEARVKKVNLPLSTGNWNVRLAPQEALLVRLAR